MQLSLWSPYATDAAHGGHNPARQPAASDARLMSIAKTFEATFLSDMLGSAGLGSEPSAFGGGFGAEAFHSLLNRAYADRLVEAGGLGLARTIYAQLQRAGGHV